MKKSLMLVALMGFNACATTGARRVSDERAPAYVANVQPEKPKSHMWPVAIATAAITAVAIILGNTHGSNRTACSTCGPLNGWAH